MNTPAQSQREQARKQANKVRAARATLKWQLTNTRPARASLNLAAEVVESPPECAASMQLHKLFMACYGVHDKTSRKMVARVHHLSGASNIGERRLGELTNRERQIIATVLRGWKLN